MTAPVLAPMGPRERRPAREPDEPRALHEASEPGADPQRQPDDVALLVARRGEGMLVHARFAQLARFVRAGDVLVVNTSATRPAALPATLDGRSCELRLSTPAAKGDWVVELRTQDLLPFRRPPIGAHVALPDKARAELLARFRGSERLCVARLVLEVPLEQYLRRHGRSIRYAHSPQPRPIDAYQTVFALEPHPTAPSPPARGPRTWWSLPSAGCAPSTAC